MPPVLLRLARRPLGICGRVRSVNADGRSGAVWRAGRHGWPACPRATGFRLPAPVNELDADWTGGGRYAFGNWDEALDRLFTAVTDRLIVIDEFPYLSKASPSLPSLIQRALEPRGTARQSRSRLLLCGSAMPVMGRLLSGSAPLRGRASLELIIRPLSYRDAASFWGITDRRLAVLVHSIVGGTLAYRREFVAGDAPSGPDDFDS